MARAAFDNAIAVYENDGSGGPGDLRFAVAARVVPKLHQIQIRPAELDFLFYANYEGSMASAGTADYEALGAASHFTTADLVEIGTDPGVFFLIVRTTIIVPPFGTAYRRIWCQ